MKRPILYIASRRTRPDPTAGAPSEAVTTRAPVVQASSGPGTGFAVTGTAGAASSRPDRHRQGPVPTPAMTRSEPGGRAPKVPLWRRGRAYWQALRAHGPARRPFSWLVALALLGTLGWLVRAALLAQAGGFSQEDIDAAVSRTLETVTLPSQAARAYEVIRPSVVRVQAFRDEDAAKPGKAAPREAGKAASPGERGKPAERGAEKSADKSADKRAEKPGDKSADKDAGKDGGKGNDKSAGKPDEKPARKQGNESVGTGVVIVDKGVILTNLHVVAGASRITVVFADGLESEATVIGVRPDNDLAVLQARTIPDDLVAAAMRSSADLAVGEMVVAVGFPFGIGPSASSGVVSGLKREYQSPEGKQTIGNLIQFDAAANPGNSGGPLVTAEGEVVGIVTGILSPGSQRVFIGIGFAVPIESAASAAGVPPF